MQFTDQDDNTLQADTQKQAQKMALSLKAVKLGKGFAGPAAVWVRDEKGARHHCLFTNPDAVSD